MNGSYPYQGMRWYKCDLHVHTPENGRHWSDPTLRLSSPRTEDDLQEKAGIFLRKCHSLGLECIAVVDHNFSAESDPRNLFLTHLIEQNKTVAETDGHAPIVIFPGFELDIRYHILCLFNPVRNGSQLMALSDILTNMGLACSSRFMGGTPQQPKHQGRCWSLREVLDKIQKEHGGIVIAGHAFSNDGICNDTANINDFVENQDLYAIEVNAWPPQGKAKAILEGTSPHWNRQQPHRQPAGICGSDGKSLGDASCANSLGYRFSWIKMSEPSIESLRQAFLDPESRILPQSEPPRVAHTHIKSVTIRGTQFLQDQTLVLSPHLNCLIGGRGSGKSMVFESMRLGLRGETTFREDHVGARQVKRLRGTFTNDTDIRLPVFHDDLEDVFAVDNSGAPSRVSNREVADATTVFRRLDALFFSQEEITQLAEQQGSLLDFIDNLTRERLDEHRNNAAVIIEKIKLFRQVQTRLQRLDEELAVLGQEVEETGRQLAAKTTVQAELKNHRAAQEAKRYVEGLTAKAVETKDRLSHLVDTLESEPPPLGSRADAFPNPDFYKAVETRVTAAYQELAGQLKSAAESFVATISQATLKNPDWDVMTQSILMAEQQFHEACKTSGLTIEEAERLRETEQQHRMKKAAQQAKQAERDQSAKELPDINDLLEKLTICWTSETRVRREIMDDIADSDTMPRTENGKAIVATSLSFAGDRERFLKQWSALSPPRNTKTGRMWDRYSRDGTNNNIGDALFDVFLNSTRNGNEIITGNPVQWLERHWNDKTLWPEILLENKEDIDSVRQGKPDKWFELQTTRVPDYADLTLLRSDGTEAGSFQRSDLSTGQKNTAILSLLLARGTGPVLIDQPEDELDSEFLFKELVPMFRSAKQHRQLIIVTHNANIPVNADAELVYALKAEGGRGICRAQGGLDRLEVTRAVLDIMEGSEDAFRRRQEKYHF